MSCNSLFSSASSVYNQMVELDAPVKIPTPYGGRLEWTMPGDNKIIAHLKDKNKIRHRKRWSQVGNASVVFVLVIQRFVILLLQSIHFQYTQILCSLLTHLRVLRPKLHKPNKNQQVQVMFLNVILKLNDLKVHQEPTSPVKYYVQWCKPEESLKQFLHITFQ